MHNDNRLLLSEYDWKNLLNQLNFPSGEDIKLTHAYFDEIESRLQISSTNSGLFISSSQLNIDGMNSIIAKRRQKKNNNTTLPTTSNSKYSVVHSYVPSFSGQYTATLKGPVSSSDIQILPQKNELNNFKNDISYNAA